LRIIHLISRPLLPGEKGSRNHAVISPSLFGEELGRGKPIRGSKNQYSLLIIFLVVFRD